MFTREYRDRLDEAVQELHPHVVVMDVTMPGMNGVEATGRIVADFPGTHVIAFALKISV